MKLADQSPPSTPSANARLAAAELLFAPRSVAVVGASDNPAKWGYGLAKGALQGAGRRTVHLVNRNGGDVQGRPSVRSLAELDAAPDLVVIGVPAGAFEAAVDDALAAGAKAIVGITSGFGEEGADGEALQQAIAARVRAVGAVLLGPNCMGVYDGRAELDLAPWLAPVAPPRHGGLAIVSQSGNLGIDIARSAWEAGIGISRFASLGNQADLDAADLVRVVANDPHTTAIGLYLEDFKRGRELAQAAAEAGEAGKTVLLLALSASEATVRAAQSHTGSLVSGDDAIDAACERAGIVRVQTPQELAELALAACAAVRPRGRRLAIVSDGGGHAALAADLVTRWGGEVPPLAAAVDDTVRTAAPQAAATGNPVDLAGAVNADLHSFERAATALLAAEEIDGLIITGNLGGLSRLASDRGTWQQTEADVALGLAEVARAAGKPIFVHSTNADTELAQQMRDAGVPVFRDPGVTVRSLLTLAARPAPRAVPQAAADDAAGAGGERHALDYWDARAVIAAAGIPLAAAELVATRDEALAAAEGIGWPVVLKAQGLLHKSDAGGVAVGLADANALGAAFDDMAARLAPERFTVEQMADVGAGAELIVGLRRDPRFGHLLLVGFGGVFTETVADAAVLLAPAEPDDVEALLDALKLAPLLHGARGRAALDTAAVARAAAAFSRLPEHVAGLAEAEVNPLLAQADGALGLDARIIVDTVTADAPAAD